jgi:hypothetical protein
LGNLIVDVIIVPIPIQRLDPSRIQLGVAFVEGLRPVLARRLDRFVARGSLKDGGALTCNDER